MNATGARWLAAAATAAFVALAAPAKAQDPRPAPFQHSQHVPDAWTAKNRSEVWRDCRGCHRFSAEQPVSAPQAVCNDCHVGDGRLELQAAAPWQKDLAPYASRSAQGFRHHTHAMLACRQCHPPAATGVSGHFAIETGPASCAPCHDGRGDAAAFDLFEGHFASADAAAQYRRELDGKRLADVFGGAAGGMNTAPLPAGTAFEHADHLAAGVQCADCHDQLERAAAGQTGLGRAPTQTCGKCHQAAAGAALRPAAPKQELRPLWSLGTFAHADHLAFARRTRKDGVCGENAYAQITAEGCASCHTQRPAVVDGTRRDFPFGESLGRHRFADCVGCHDRPAWQTGEGTGGTPRLHGGDGAGGSGFRACAGCHTFAGGSLADDRPTAEVERATGRTFVFPAQTHPDITTRGVERGAQQGRPAIEDCAKCHRARVPELPTRLEARAFRHDTHLPVQPTSADCAVCHPSAAAATTSRSRALAARGNRTYDLAACGKCHWGGAVSEQEVPGRPLAAARRVVEFAHAAHTQNGRLACTECHAPDADGGEIVTRPEALACRQCHDHKEGGSRAEILFGSQVASCARCHRAADRAAPARADVPSPRGAPANAQDPRYARQQDVFGGFAAPQFHPLDRACTECHLQATAVVRPDVADHVPAVRRGKVHRDGAMKEPAECLRCHWTPCGSVWSSHVNGAGGSVEERRLRASPAGAEARTRFGNEREGYPGTARAKG
jgi:hypothetical protein